MMTDHNDDVDDHSRTLLGRCPFYRMRQKKAHYNCAMNGVDNRPHHQQQHQQKHRRQQNHNHHYNDSDDDDDQSNKQNHRNNENRQRQEQQKQNHHKFWSSEAQQHELQNKTVHSIPSLPRDYHPQPQPEPYPLYSHHYQQQQERKQKRKTQHLNRSNNKNETAKAVRSKSIAPVRSKGPIRINVNGRLFVLSKSTCIRIPVLQGMLTRMKLHHKENLEINQRGRTSTIQAPDPTMEELFFERNSTVFAAVVDYVQNNELHVPPHVCPKLFARDLSFWGFDIDEVESCCFSGVVHFLWEQDRLTKFHGFLRPSTGIQAESTTTKSDECMTKEIEIPVLGLRCMKWQQFRISMWKILDEPFTSKVAQVYFYTMCVFILTSFFTIAADTETFFKQSDGTSEPWITVLSYVCNAYLYLDYFLRIFFYPDLRQFLRNFVNITDGVAVLSIVAKTITEHFFRNVDPTWKPWVEAIDSLQLLRILRLLRPMSKVIGFRLIYFTLKCSFHELLLVFMLLLFLTMIFSSLLYYLGDRNSMQSIPHAMWFSLTTMTTVGYGDIVPDKARTKVIGSVVAVFGVILMSMTMPIMVSNFNLLYINAVVGLPSAINKVHQDIEKMQHENTSSMMASVIQKGIKTESPMLPKEAKDTAMQPEKEGRVKQLLKCCCPQVSRKKQEKDEESGQHHLLTPEILARLSKTNMLLPKKRGRPRDDIPSGVSEDSDGAGSEADVDTSEPDYGIRSFATCVEAITNKSLGKSGTGPRQFTPEETNNTKQLTSPKTRETTLSRSSILGCDRGQMSIASISGEAHKKKSITFVDEQSQALTSQERVLPR